MTVPRRLELVEKKTYGLALIDYRMPGMDGVELYRRIRPVAAGRGGCVCHRIPHD